MTAERASRALGVLNAFYVHIPEMMNVQERLLNKYEESFHSAAKPVQCILSPRTKNKLYTWTVSGGLVYKSPQTTAEALFNDQAQPRHLSLGHEALMDYLKSSPWFV